MKHFQKNQTIIKIVHIAELEPLLNFRIIKKKKLISIKNLKLEDLMAGIFSFINTSERAT